MVILTICWNYKKFWTDSFNEGLYQQADVDYILDQ